MRTMRVNLNGGYPISIERGLIGRVGERLPDLLRAEKLMLVTDETVDARFGAPVEASLLSAGYRVQKLVLPAGEKTKSPDSLARLWSAMALFSMARTDALVALGGGVIGDLGGFAAATYARGIDFVGIPTSLLAQVDSSIGGKVAVDLPEGKNLAGAFHQPKAVLIDPDALATLDGRLLADGMGEVIKCGCIRDAQLLCIARQGWARVDAEEMIARALEVKRTLVEADERDVGERMLLNFGHTLGHAFEVAQNYGGMRHGEAVAAGMALIARFGEEVGLTRRGTAECVEDCLRQWNLPTSAPRALWPKAREAMRNDKKWLDGELHLVLLRQIGQAERVKYPAQALEEVEKWLV